MKKFLFFAALALCLNSCQKGIEGNGNVKEETRESAPFDKIEVEGSFDIFIKPGNYNAATVVADENLLQYIQTYVKGGVLHVETKERLSHYKKLELMLIMNKFNGADISGACKLRSNGTLNGDEVGLDFSGAVKTDMDLKCQSLDVDMSGASQLAIRGEAQKSRFEISGAGNIDAAEFKNEECQVKISGAGQADVYSTEKLDINVSGAAKVRYRGNPGQIKQDVSGAASVKPI